MSLTVLHSALLANYLSRGQSFGRKHNPSDKAAYAMVTNNVNDDDWRLAAMRAKEECAH